MGRTRALLRRACRPSDQNSGAAGLFVRRRLFFEDEAELADREGGELALAGARRTDDGNLGPRFGIDGGHLDAVAERNEFDDGVAFVVTGAHRPIPAPCAQTATSALVGGMRGSSGRIVSHPVCMIFRPPA